MNKSEASQKRKAHRLFTTIRKLFLYVLIPILLLIFLSKPVGDAVRRSDTAAFLILLAGLAAVMLNWSVCWLICRQRPSLLVFALGCLCLLALTIVEQEALPAYYTLTSTLAFIAGSLLLASLLLLSFWFASRRSRPAHVVAVGIRITLGVILFFMAYRVLRAIEIGNITADTWLTAGFMTALVLGWCGPRIHSACRRRASRRRKTGLAAGTIVQIIGETHLDLDDDPVTRNHARIQYAVNDVLYETRADISRFTTRRFGREAFVGREIPVFYNPADPADAYVNRIDKHLFDQDRQNADKAADQMTENAADLNDRFNRARHMDRDSETRADRQ